MAPVIRSGPSVYQTSHDLLCQWLREVMVEGVRAGCGGAGGIGSVPCRVSATLYALLIAHPLDRRGRCRGRGLVFGRRRRCWVHHEASYWLRQPEGFLYAQVVREWDLTDQPLPDRDGATRRAGLDDTDVLPAMGSRAAR